MNTKSLVRGLIISVVLAAPLAVFAQAVVSTGAGSTSPVASPVFAQYRACTVLDRNLSLGQRGDDVRALQEYLIGEGILKATATGFFGSMTRSAVTQWQMGNGVRAAGSFGPLSRERIKSLCGNSRTLSVTPQNGDAPLVVTFTTTIGINDALPWVDFGDGQKDVMTKGSCIAIMAIKGGQGGIRCAATGSHTYSQNGSYTARLSASPKGSVVVTVGDPNPNNGSITADPQSGSAPLAVTFTYHPSSETGTYWIDFGDGQGQQMDVHQIYCFRAPCISPSVASHTYTTPGTYSAYVTAYIGCMHTTPRCMIATVLLAKTTVTVTDTNSSGTPVISGFSGPVSLSVNEVGTWKIIASDPANGSLNYSILWGDESTNGAMPNKTMAPASSIQQNTSFTHSYTSAGNYTVAVTVTNAAGKSSQSTASVQVGQMVCTAQYQPVCARPNGCSNTCAPGMNCTMQCQLYPPQTYSNRCVMNTSNATFMHDGACAGNEGYLQ